METKNKMFLPERLDNAIRVLYTAFHEGELEAYECEKCAVGNLVGGSPWNGGYYTEFSQNLLGYKEIEPVVVCGINKTGYSGMELAIIEKLFMQAHSDNSVLPKKEQQFNGLCAVISYLCSLDGVEDVMGLQGLFETDGNGERKLEIEEVLG